MDFPEAPDMTLEDGTVYQPPSLSLKAKATVLSTVTVPSLIADVAFHGGFWGAVTAVGVGLGAVYLAPAVAPYIEDARRALDTSMARERVRRGARRAQQQMEGEQDTANHFLSEEESLDERGASGRFDVGERVMISIADLPPPMTTPFPYEVPPPPDHMDFGKTLRPHANKVFSGRKAIFGVSDAGKSNDVAVIAEEMAKFGGAIFVLDTEGEYGPLCQRPYFPNPLSVDKRTLEYDRAYQFAQWAAAGLYQVVINLQSYEDAEAAWLMIGLIKGLKDWEEAQEVRVPCEIVLDEATVWLPERASNSVLSKIKVEDPEALALYDWFAIEHEDGEDQGDEDEEKSEKAGNFERKLV